MELKNFFRQQFQVSEGTFYLIHLVQSNFSDQIKRKISHGGLKRGVRVGKVQKQIHVLFEWPQIRNLSFFVNCTKKLFNFVLNQ